MDAHDRTGAYDAGTGWLSVRAVFVVASLCAVLLGGCTDEGPAPDPACDADCRSTHEFLAGRGAIAGLLVDDRFRPLDLDALGGTLLVQEMGLQTSHTPNGEFSILGLEAGTYTIRVTIPGHEATPAEVDVVAGQFTEVTIVARRIVNLDDTIVSQEFAVFLPCSDGLGPFGGGNPQCDLDFSEDAYPSGYTQDLTALAVAGIVTEVTVSNDQRHQIIIRADDDGEDAHYIVLDFTGAYGYAALVAGEATPSDEEWLYGEMLPFDNTRPIRTMLFEMFPLKDESNDLGVPNCCGYGVRFGTKATFVQSLFFDGYDGDVRSYCAICG